MADKAGEEELNKLGLEDISNTEDEDDIVEEQSLVENESVQGEDENEDENEEEREAEEDQLEELDNNESSSGDDTEVPPVEGPKNSVEVQGEGKNLSGINQETLGENEQKTTQPPRNLLFTPKKSSTLDEEAVGEQQEKMGEDANLPFQLGASWYKNYTSPWGGEDHYADLDETEFHGEYEVQEIPGPEAPSILSLEVEDLEDALNAIQEQPEPERLDSDEEFEETYMNSIPGTPIELQGRMSLEAINLPSRESTPSPPGTPKKTLRRMHECPSVESFLKLGDPVRIHFIVLPGQKIFTIDARMDRTILDIKREISPICKVPAEYLDLRKNRNLVMDYKTLRDLGAKPRRKMKFTVEISKRCPDEYVLKIPEENLIKQLPSEVRKVQVKGEKGWKTLKIAVEYSSEPKPFIGGYRDKRKNVYYHNAITQTPFKPNAYSENVAHFSCQTFDDTWKKVQTLVDDYQQTTRPDYYISTVKQRVLYPRVYITADQVEHKRIQAAIIIQKYWRRWLAKRERAARLEGLIKRIEWAENIRKGRTESRLAIKEDEIWRQNHPARMVDVELLYRAINEWRRKEVEYVNQHRWGPDRKAALAEIMEKEADLLLDLERTKSTIRKNMRDGYVDQIFHKMGDPTRWLNKSGNFIALDNKEKQNMRQYHKLYDLLRAPVVEMEKRLEILHKIKEITQTYSSRGSKYLASLIEREFLLIDYNAGPKLLDGLRHRILSTFYNLLRDPGFNPEAKKLQKVPFDTKKLRKDMVQCKGCRKMQYREHFTVVRGVTVTTRCSQCIGLYRTCILRSDLNLYRGMLKELRHDEQSAGVESSVTYLIDAYDLQFIIEQLWHGQSALSGISDRYLLRICRWKRDQPWTPWNCVLLTEEEAVAHLHLDDIEAAYQPAFLHKVSVKHQGAKIYFARLSVLAIPLDPNLNDVCQQLKKDKKIKAIKARQRETEFKID